MSRNRRRTSGRISKRRTGRRSNWKSSCVSVSWSVTTATVTVTPFLREATGGQILLTWRQLPNYLEPPSHYSFEWLWVHFRFWSVSLGLILNILPPFGHCPKESPVPWQWLPWHTLQITHEGECWTQLLKCRCHLVRAMILTDHKSKSDKSLWWKRALF